MPWLGSWTAMTRVVGVGVTTGSWNTWNAYLYPYLESGQAKDVWNNEQLLFAIFQCPSHPRRIRQDSTATWGPTAYLYSNSETGVSYGINTAYLGPNACASGWNAHGSSYPLGRPGWPGFGVGITGMNDNTRQRDRFRRTSSTIQIAEHLGQPLLTQQNRTNWTDPPFARPPIGRDGMPLVPPAEFGSWSAGFPIADTLTGYSVRIAHGAKSNYLFVDGHVASHTPWETCSADPTLPNLWTGR